MKIKSLLFIFCALAICLTTALAQPGGGKGSKRHAPPAEAIEACKDKGPGDKASFTSPHGDEVTGICEERDGQMVLHPDNPPKRREG